MNMDKLNAIYAQNELVGKPTSPQISKVWQRFLENGQQFSVEQVDFANGQDNVKAAFSALADKYILYRLIFDEQFCSSEMHSKLCDNYINLFLKQAAKFKSATVDENTELKKKVAELEAQLKKKVGKNE